MGRVNRREALRRMGTAVLGACATASGCGFDSKDPRGGIPGTVGFTLHTGNVSGALEEATARLTDLGADFVRLPLNTGDPAGGRTIVRRLLDAGLSILGITAGYEGLRTDSFEPVPRDKWRAYLVELLRIYPEIRFWQVLNEPRFFESISEEAYVVTYLSTAYQLFKDRDPSLTVVSAASIGNRYGPAQFRRMVDAGLENWCDVAAVHVYSAWPEDFAGLVPNPVWVTETGSSDGSDAQVSFFRANVPSMVDGDLKADRIFWYDLLDDPEVSHYGLLGLDGQPVNSRLYEAIGSFNRGRSR